VATIREVHGWLIAGMATIRRTCVRWRGGWDETYVSQSGKWIPELSGVEFFRVEFFLHDTVVTVLCNLK
jgi:hypothetical protein